MMIDESYLNVMRQTFFILMRTGPQNDARLKPVRSAKKVADP